MGRDGLTTVPEAAPQATAPARGVRRGSFRALGSTPFRLYFADQVVSASGTFLQQDREHFQWVDHQRRRASGRTPFGAGSCRFAAGIAPHLHTPPNPDAALTVLVTGSGSIVGMPIRFVDPDDYRVDVLLDDLSGWPPTFLVYGGRPDFPRRQPDAGQKTRR
jgi:hypothetical protein